VASFVREYLSSTNQPTTKREKARTMTDLPIKRSFKDDFGVEIMFYEWPVANPKAVIQIAHGLGEHARRYDVMAATLNKAGFSVYADDHRGHGQTGLKQIENKQTSKLGQLGPGGMKATIAQVASMSELIKAENPDRPLVLLGHSWGGYIAQKIINDYSSRYQLVVLSGSGLSLPGYSATGNFNKEFSKPQEQMATNGCQEMLRSRKALPKTHLPSWQKCSQFLVSKTPWKSLECHQRKLGLIYRFW
jgi:pimeloyl-ACP methyl ester carboxylesterase